MKRLKLNNKNSSPWEGILLVDKPFGYTSHDVVAAIRKLLGVKKVGHLGSLDPMATGLLPLVLGRATIFSRFLMAGEKHYVAWIHLGFFTITYDIEGEKTLQAQNIFFTKKVLHDTLKTFLGKISQEPPPFSARKVKGKKLYELARKGQVVKGEPKEINIYSIKMLSFINDMICLDIKCSAGTYIRSIAHDLGQKLDCGAYLSSLIRIESGAFHLKNALSLTEIEMLLKKNELAEKIIPLSTISNYLPCLTLPISDLNHINREIIQCEEYFQCCVPPPVQEGYYRITDDKGKLLAITKAIETKKEGQFYLKPEIIFV